MRNKDLYDKIFQDDYGVLTRNIKVASLAIYIYL